VPRHTDENSTSSYQDVFAIVVGVKEFFINQKRDLRSGIRFGWMAGVRHFEPTSVDVVELYGPINTDTLSRRQIGYRSTITLSFFLRFHPPAASPVGSSPLRGLRPSPTADPPSLP
jgi:hypothetical protein